MRKIDVNKILRLAGGNAVASLMSLAVTTDITTISSGTVDALAAVTAGEIFSATIGDMIQDGMERDHLKSVDEILTKTYFKSRDIISEKEQNEILLAVDMIINDESGKVKTELLDPDSIFSIDQEVNDWLKAELKYYSPLLENSICNAVEHVKRTIQKWVIQNNIFDVLLAAIEEQKQDKSQIAELKKALIGVTERIHALEHREYECLEAMEATEAAYPYYLSGLPTDLLSCYFHREVLEETIWNEVVQNRNSILLYGMGGIGKTETAKSILHRISSQQSDKTGIYFIIWVNYFNGSLKASLIQAIRENKPTKTIEEAWEYVQYLVQTKREQLLIVIDNVETVDEDPELNRIGNYPCRVLVTSRTEKVGSLKGHPVDILPIEDCRKLFYAHYQGDQDDYNLNRILELVDRHTVMIELLAKTASLEEMQLNMFYRKLVDHGLRISNEEVNSEHQLLSKERKVTEQLKILFTISSCTDSKKELLCQLSVIPSIPFQYHEVNCWLDIENKSSLEYLVKTGWLKSDGKHKTTYVMHSVVASAIRFQYENTLYHKCRHIVHAITKEMSMTEKEYGSQKSYLIPFSWSISDVFRDNLCDEDDALFLTMLAQIYFDIGNYEQAYHFFERALEIDQSVNSDITDDYYNLADVCMNMNRYQEAFSYLKKAIKIRKQEYEINDINVLVLYKMLAAVLVHLNRLPRAEKIFLWVKDELEKKEDCDTLYLCTLYCDIASFYREREYPGDLEKSLSYYQKAEEGFKETYGDLPHPEMAAFYDSFALLYERMGMYKEALDLFKHSLDMKQNLLEELHPDIVSSYCSIGLMYYFMDDTKAALTNLENSLEIANKLWSGNSSYKATIYTNLGLVYRRLNDIEHAKFYYSEALKIRSKLYPYNHPLILALRNNIAQVYADDGALEEATAEYEELIKAYESNDKGVISASLATVYDNLSDVYRQLEHYKDALDRCKTGLHMREQIYGQDSTDYAYSLNNLGLIYYQSGEIDLARDLFIEALELKLKHYPPIHSQISIGFFNLALAYDQLGEDEDALQNYFKAIEIDQQLEDYDSVSLSLDYIIEIYERNECQEEAEYYRSFFVDES